LVQEEEFNWKTTEATYNPPVQDLYARLENAKMDKKEVKVGLHGQIKEMKKEVQYSNDKKEKEIRSNIKNIKIQTMTRKKVDPSTVVSLGAGVGSLVDRAEVVDGSVGHLRNNFQVRLRR